MEPKKGLLVYAAQEFLVEQVVYEQGKRDDIFLARSPEEFKRLFGEKRNCFHIIGIECEFDYDPKELLDFVIGAGFKGQVFGLYKTVMEGHIHYLSEWPREKYFAEMFGKFVFCHLSWRAEA